LHGLQRNDQAYDMTSLQLFLLNAALRFYLRPKAARVKTPFDLRQLPSSRPRAPRGARFRPDTVGGVHGEWADTEGEPLATMCYLHGGGYASLSARDYRSLTGGFAKRGFRVFTPNYRLAPEHRYPAALDDAAAAFNAMAETESAPVFLCGDSAGGGLAAALMTRLRDEGRLLPAAACLFSAWLDLTNSSPSRAANQTRDLTVGPMAPVVMDTFAAAYANGADLRGPTLSPLFGSLKGLPPTILFVGESEVLRDDSVRFAERGRAHGMTIGLEVWPHVPHVWPLLHMVLPEGRKAIDRATAFLSHAASRRPDKTLMNLVESPVAGPLPA
jgi:acetyl esterase/lipase